MKAPSVFVGFVQSVAMPGRHKATDSAILGLLSYFTAGRSLAIGVDEAYARIRKSNWAVVAPDSDRFSAAVDRLTAAGAVVADRGRVLVVRDYWDAAERDSKAVRMLASDFRRSNQVDAIVIGMIRWRTRIKASWSDAERFMAKAIGVCRARLRRLIERLEAAGSLIRAGKRMIGKAFHTIVRHTVRSVDPAPARGGSKERVLPKGEKPELPEYVLNRDQTASGSVHVLESRMRTEHVLRSYALWDSDSPPVSARRAQIARRLDLHGWTPDAVDSVLAGIGRDPSVRDPKRFAAALLARGCEFSRWLDQGSHVDDRRVTGLLDGLLRSLAVTPPRDPVPCHAARSYPGGVNSHFKAPEKQISAPFYHL